MTNFANNQSKISATLRAEAMEQTKLQRMRSKKEYLERQAARRNGGVSALNIRRRNREANRNKIKIAEDKGEWININKKSNSHKLRDSKKNKDVTFIPNKRGGFKCLIDDDSSDSEDENDNITNNAINIPIAHTIPKNGRAPFNSPLPSPSRTSTWAEIASIQDKTNDSVVKFDTNVISITQTPINSPITYNTHDTDETYNKTNIKNNSWADEMDSDIED